MDKGKIKEKADSNSGLLKSVKDIKAARDRDRSMSDGGGTGRSDTNDCVE